LMENNVVYCSQCGTQSTGGAGFCQKCGARLVSALAGVPATVSGGAYPTAAAPAFLAAGTGEHYAGFWIRVVAYLVDHVLLAAAVAPFYFLLVLPNVLRIVHQAQQENREPGPEVFANIFGAMFFVVFIALIGSWLYEALLTSSPWQGTVGKRILRLKVTDDLGRRISFARATGRFFAKILSGMVMDVGFIMVAFMERKRGLHDLICSTQVLRY
jgi:uncharacterized RDD family membrane protein YckC